MTILAWISVVAVGALAVHLVHFNLKRLHIIRCAARASDEQLERIYSLIEEIGEDAPTCAVLGRTNSRAVGTFQIPIPSYVPTWGGQVVTVDVATETATLRFIHGSSKDAIIRDKVYRVVSVPKVKTKSGKVRNQFSPARYLSKNPRLLPVLSEICPRYPAHLLSYLLSPGSETFEEGDQVRIGGSPAWLQEPEFPSCRKCKKRMELILDLPGALLPERPFPEGEFYFFGCKEHPEEMQTITQAA